MLKKPKSKNNFFKLILSLVLLLTPVFAGVDGSSVLGVFVQDVKAETAQSPTTSSPQDIKPQTIPEKNIKMFSHMGKEKVQKLGFKDALFKFFMAMLGVLVSSLAIFGGLNLYKKVVLKNNKAFDEKDYENTLESPKDFKEAINLFLNKTDK